MSDPIMVDAPDAAAHMGVSERKWHELRNHPLYPPDTEVHLSARCVRFRLERLREFAALLAESTARLPEPSRLKAARERRAAQKAAPDASTINGKRVRPDEVDDPDEVEA